MGLQQYHAKRNFARTPEPRGEASPRAPAARSKPSEGLSFVIQKHAARRLHYDFRLELDGVMLSWAVPKGPSLDPSVRRLAAQTEDHPLEYQTFEGIIPEGEYGGGTVLVWDRGTWEPDGDPRAAYAKGHLRFWLHGEKLHGAWHLVRSRSDARGKPQWLLFKSQDEAAQPGAAVDIVDESPNSVISGRSLEQIKGEPDRVWHSKEASQDRPALPRPSQVAGAKKAPLPEAIDAQLATLVEAAPNGDDWLHEIKFDGYRLICRIEAGEVTVESRNGKDWTASVPALVRTLASLPLRSAVFDGELVVLNESGVSDFQALQNALSQSDEGTTYFVFDLLYLDGYDLRELATLERKIMLDQLLRALNAGEGRIRYSDHVQGNGAAFHQQACGMGLEGIISKRAGRPYLGGRGRDWVKIKCQARQEFVIAGYSEPGGSRSHFGALLLGSYEDGRLIYRGKVGTGFTARSLKELHQRLVPLRRKTSALVAPPRGADARGVSWVEPQLVAEVEFTGVTSDGRLRHPSFQGLREDKAASDVHLERPAPEAPRAPSPHPTSPQRAASQSTAAKSTAGEPSRAKSKTAKSKTAGEPSRAKSKTAKSTAKTSTAVKSKTVKSTAPAKPTAAKSRATTRAADAGRSRGSAPARGSAEPAASDEAAAARFLLTNPDRVLYPEHGITKAELAEYYVAVSEWILPHVARRPLTIVRCPEGHTKQCFFQKHVKQGAPEGILPVAIQEKDGPEEYVYIEDLKGLLGVVQLGTLELHTWGAHVDQVERPDQLVFDLDPDEGLPWQRVAEAALLVRERLRGLGLESFLKTTGGKGLHVVLPINRRTEWDDAKRFTQLVAEAIVREQPRLYVATLSKALRRGKVFIDYLRNGRGATAVAAYSTRARRGAPVSTPLDWEELDRLRGPEAFTLRALPSRLHELARDPWEGFFDVKQSLTSRMFRTLGG